MSRFVAFCDFECKDVRNWYRESLGDFVAVKKLVKYRIAVLDGELQEEKVLLSCIPTTCPELIAAGKKNC